MKLPASLRQADPRALQVRDRDPGDFPAAALAALLSPCLLLTCNYKHFGALGVRTHTQSVDGVMAVVAINVGEMQVRAVVMIPPAPAMTIDGAVKWVYDRVGPITWLILGVLTVGGIYWYRKQPPERQEQIKKVAGEVGTHLLEGTRNGRGRRSPDSPAAACLRGAQARAADYHVGDPARAGDLAGVALAQQLAELLDPSLRPSVSDLRAYFRAHDNTVFDQVRGAASYSAPITSCRAEPPPIRAARSTSGINPSACATRWRCSGGRTRSPSWTGPTGW